MGIKCRLRAVIQVSEEGAEVLAWSKHKGARENLTMAS